MTPEEHLLAAADDMAQHGHCKESFFERPWGKGWETSPACALGSLARAAGLNDKGFVPLSTYKTEAGQKLAAHIREKFPHIVADGDSDDPYSVITRFNDDDTTTAEDMILAFKEAAHD